ncbi:chemotaxis protein CheB [Meridianimarinicoccus sp. RP-17]|uniref:chemotaxis protein CheB n=1 Tax=Meridianimarinicoccus zhengii TaxID=2056810 RepID=UPI000DAB7BC8|nr:chemotaxis protein CheB [Phycocomes zhengii]
MQGTRVAAWDDHADAGEKHFVVAIGASAGGLDALERLFQGMPNDTGAAFVVIQHLSPDHKSMMASLLARHTAMPVVTVEDDMPLAPNTVFLIPPGAIMKVEGRQLRLTPKAPRVLTLPIDEFFHSMAPHYGDHAVGVVLSGTGSDGTRGAGAINEAGGFLIAQDPADARFDGMPRSVIATGLVDAVLPVDGIGERLTAHLTSQPVQIRAGDAPHVDDYDGPDDPMSGIVHLLMRSGHVNFEDYKPGTVNRRIERRMSVRQTADLDGYYRLLQADPDEQRLLKRELLIPVTRFFRDPDAFETLSEKVVQPLVAGKASGDAIRIWSVGTSTGEEAYSIAMMFLEAFDTARKWPQFKVFATDVEQANVDLAAAGIYPASIEAEIGPGRVDKYFLRRGDQLQVRPDLRQSIVFARHNLLADPPFTKLDLAICRNMLIYFKTAAQDRVLRKLQYALRMQGFLFLGSSETLGAAQGDFGTVCQRHRIWQKQRESRIPLRDIASDAAPRSGQGSYRATAPVTFNRVPKSAVELGYKSLMDGFGPPPAVLVNERQEIVHSYGKVQQFLRVREGAARLDLSRMLPTSLVPVASAVLFRLARTRERTASDPVRFEDEDGNRQRVRLHAVPAGERDGETLGLLVFEELQPDGAGTGSDPVNVMDEASERVEILENELAATRENLQATIEELEASNEELQATNEEMMASNEELQSSNEELQSVNEELNTVNAEYQEKIQILNRLNADLDNLTQIVSTGAIFVDADICVTRFSPGTAGIFSLRDTDIGRPLGELNHTLDYPALMSDLRRTLQSHFEIETEVTGAAGRTFLVKMIPYKVPSSSEYGAVLTLLDTTDMRARLRLQAVIDSLAEHIAVLDSQGTILMVNHAWKEFGRNAGDPGERYEAVGVNYLDVCRVEQGAPDSTFAEKARTGLGDLLAGKISEFSLFYPCHGRDERAWFVMNARPLGGDFGGAVVSHVDVTEWQKENPA